MHVVQLFKILIPEAGHTQRESFDSILLEKDIPELIITHVSENTAHRHAFLAE